MALEVLQYVVICAIKVTPCRFKNIHNECRLGSKFCPRWPIVRIIEELCWRTFREHGGPKIPCSKDFLCREGTNKLAPISAIMTCYKNIKDFYLIDTPTKHPIQFPLQEIIGDDNIMMTMNPLVQSLGDCWGVEEINNLGIS